MLTDQGLALTYNAGIVGNNAGEVLARLQSDVLAYMPNFVTVWVGANDITQNRSLASYQGEMGQIVDRLQAAGCTVAIITIPPRADTTKHAAIGAWNAWLRGFARAKSCHLIDAYALLVDPTTGTYKSGYDAGDGLHITQAGHNVIARYVADTIAPRLALSESIRPPVQHGHEQHVVERVAHWWGDDPGQLARLRPHWWHHGDHRHRPELPGEGVGGRRCEPGRGAAVPSERPRGDVGGRRQAPGNGSCRLRHRDRGVRDEGPPGEPALLRGHEPDHYGRSDVPAPRSQGCRRGDRDRPCRDHDGAAREHRRRGRHRSATYRIGEAGIFNLTRLGIN